MKHKLRQLLALILALSMSLSLLSANVWAAETSEGEVEILRSESVDEQEDEPEEEPEEEPESKQKEDTEGEESQEEEETQSEEEEAEAEEETTEEPAEAEPEPEEKGENSQETVEQPQTKNKAKKLGKSRMLTAQAAGGTEVTQANVICQQYSYDDAGSYSGGAIYDTPPADITNIALADAQAFGAAVNCPTTYWVVVYAKDGDNLKWTSNGKTGEQTSTPRSASGRVLSAWCELYNGDAFFCPDPMSDLTFYFSKGLATVAVTGVSLDKTTAQTIDVDGKVSFTATVAPDNATDKKVKWSVGGTDAGAVKLYTDEACTTEVGADATETLTVYAKGNSAGSATVTATSNADSTKSAGCEMTVEVATLKGSGTADDPYQISTKDDWDILAGWINSGMNADKYYKQTSDISGISVIVGNSQNTPFKGTYDGNGYTIEAAIDATNNQYAAPFQYADGAVIKNVKMTGSIKGGKHCSGLVGTTMNSPITIQSCEVAATITTTALHWDGSRAMMGGLVGHGQGKSNTVSDCLFSGSFDKTASDGNYCVGAIYGWSGDNAEARNCLVYGYEIVTGDAWVNGVQIGRGLDSSKTINCYSRAEGTTGDLVESLGSGWIVVDNMAVPNRGQIHSVIITPGSNMTKTTDSGAESQTGLSGAMTDVVYTANDGYYFPENYSVAAVNGISVTRNSYTQITVAGTPTADATITLTAPTAKTTPAAPTTAGAVDCTTSDNNDGKLTGVTAEMEYKKSDAADWTAGTGSDIMGLVPGTYYVRVKATDTTNASDNQELTVNAAQTPTETLLTTITPTGKTTYSETTAGVVTVSHNNDFYYGPYGWVWMENADTLTVSACEGYTITKCIFKQNAKSPVTDSSAPFELHFDSLTYGVQCREDSRFDGVTSIEVYGYATPTATHSVTITPGDNMTKTDASGATSQSDLSGAMTDVVYTADDGYYFPTDYGVATVNGISVTWDSYTQITVAGTPTADATITLTAPTAKTTPAAPTTAGAVDCTTSDNNDGKLAGVTTAMEYKKSDATDWTAGTGSDITGLVPGTYYVRLKATDTTNASANQELTIKGFISYTVTFKVVNGSWDEGEGDAATADKTVTLTGHDGDTLKLTADQIPAVGSKPNDTYKAGSWDTTPSADTAITEATTYTYTYVAKEASVVTKAPEAKTLTYNGQAQELVTAGTATGGEMKYALGNATEATQPYTTSIPTETNAGTYTVWYKVVGDSNHNDIAPAKVDVTIAQKEVGLSWSNTSFTYDGKAHAPVATAGDLVKDDKCDVTVEGEQTNVGSYAATATNLSNVNYKLPSNVQQNFTINKAEQSAPAAPKVSKTTTTSITVKANSGEEYSMDGKTWQKSGTFKGLQASKSYKVYARKAENANYKASPASKATQVQTKNNYQRQINTGLKLTQTKNQLKVKWGKVDDANRYEVYATYCGKALSKKPTLVLKSNKVNTATITKLNGKKLIPTKQMRVVVVAKKGSKVLTKSMGTHVVGRKNKKLTNVKSVKLNKNTFTIKKGKTAQIKGTVTLANKKRSRMPDKHVAKFRFLSYDKSVATVDKNGKITAKGTGKCVIHVFAHNGLTKKVTVTVK